MKLLAVIVAAFLMVAKTSFTQSLVATGAELEELTRGYATVEGPLFEGDGHLYFTDIPNEHIWMLNVKTLEKALFRDQTGGANGLAFDRFGRLLMCKQREKCLTRLEKDGQETVLLRPTRTKLNGGLDPVGVNDVVVDRLGGIYVTVPGAGSVYRLSPDGRHPIPIVSGLSGPNGLMLSPDETTLYVSEYKKQTLHAFDVNIETGVMTNKRFFASVKPASDYGCDGMTVDQDGNLYCAGPHAVRVWNPSGELIETINVPQSPTNCAFGGRGSSDLYITGRSSVYRIRLTTKGAR